MSDIVCPKCNNPTPADRQFCVHCNALVKATGDPLLQRRVGNYQLIQRVGVGGMGVVYLAEHINLGKYAAIKFLHPQFASDEEVVERFRREARVLSALEHENIIRELDFGWLEGAGFYLVMDYLEGQTLKQVIQTEGALEPQRALSIFEQLCDALEEAHVQGVVHRDLKPENLFLVNKRGREVVKILDFGIARIAYREEGQEFTGHGEVYGSPTYMSPEQAKGDIDRIDHRSDLYAATVILVETLTGKPPFVGKSATDVMLAHLMKSPPPLAELAPHIQLPDYLDAIVAKGMAKHPEQRFSSARDLRLSLREAFPHLQLPSLGPLPQRRFARELSNIQSAPQVLKQGTAAKEGGVGLAPNSHPGGTPHPSFYRGQSAYPQNSGSYPRSDQPPLSPVSAFQSDVRQMENHQSPVTRPQGRERTPAPFELARRPDSPLRQTAGTIDPSDSQDAEETRVLAIPGRARDTNTNTDTISHRDAPDPSAQWDQETTNAMDPLGDDERPLPPRDARGVLASTKALPEDVIPEVLKPMSIEELPSISQHEKEIETKPEQSSVAPPSSAGKRRLLLILLGVGCTAIGVLAAVALFQFSSKKNNTQGNQDIQILTPKLPPLPQTNRSRVAGRTVVPVPVRKRETAPVRPLPVGNPAQPIPSRTNGTSTQNNKDSRQSPAGLNLKQKPAAAAPRAPVVRPAPTVRRLPQPRSVPTIRQPSLPPVRARVFARKPPKRAPRRARRRVARRSYRRTRRRFVARRAPVAGRGQIKLRIVTFPSKAIVLNMRKKYRCTTPCTLYFKKFKSVFLLVTKKGHTTRPLRWRALRDGARVVRLPKDPFSR